jgi:phosphoglycerate dehydrogenase-like enzyme
MKIAIVGLGLMGASLAMALKGFRHAKLYGTDHNAAVMEKALKCGVVDEEALLTALDTGKVAAAALDVYSQEPVRDERIFQHERISLTPHIGASTMEAQTKIGKEIDDVIQSCL